MQQLFKQIPPILELDICFTLPLINPDKIWHVKFRKIKF